MESASTLEVCWNILLRDKKEKRKKKKAYLNWDSLGCILFFDVAFSQCTRIVLSRLLSNFFNSRCYNDEGKLRKLMGVTADIHAEKWMLLEPSAKFSFHSFFKKKLIFKKFSNSIQPSFK